MHPTDAGVQATHALFRHTGSAAGHAAVLVAVHSTQVLFRHTGSLAAHAVVFAAVHSTQELLEQIRPGPQSGVSTQATQLPAWQAPLHAIPMSAQRPPLQLWGWRGSAGSQRISVPLHSPQMAAPPETTQPLVHVSSSPHMREVQVCFTLVLRQRVSPLLHALQAVPVALHVCPVGQLLVMMLPFVGWQRRSVLPTHAALGIQWPVESHTVSSPSVQS